MALLNVNPYIKAALRLRLSPAARLLYRLARPLWNGFGRLPAPKKARAILQAFNPDLESESLLPAPRTLLPAKHDLTIIVAAYNMEQYLEECLDSVLYQDTKYDIEVRVVDDCSTDNTAFILRQYLDKRIKVYTNPSNRGPGGARNTALEGLESRYVCILDADDKLEPGAIDRALSKAYAAQADILEVGLTSFNDKGDILRTLVPAADSDDTPPEKIAAMPTFFLYDCRLFERIKYPEGYWYEDIIFESLIMLQAKRIASLEGPYYLYRQRPGSITQSVNRPKQLDSLYIGRKTILESARLGLWTTARNRAYLTDLLCHIIRITYVRTHRFSAAVRKSVFVSWREYLAENNDMLPLESSDPRSESLLQAIRQGCYSDYELNCIFGYYGR